MKSKVYVQHFFFDSLKTDYVSIKWKAGLNEFFIYHKKNLIQKIEGNVSIKNGITVSFPEAGDVYIRLVTKPIGFEVRLGDRYLFQSRIIAKEKLTAISQIFVVTGILTIGLNINFPAINSSLDLLYYIPLTIGLFYIVASYFIKKGYLSLYVFGLVIFTFSTLLTILMLGWAGIVFHFVRVGLLIVIFSHVKYILALQKHEKSLKQLDLTSNEILDDINI